MPFITNAMQSVGKFLMRIPTNSSNAFYLEIIPFRQFGMERSKTGFDNMNSRIILNYWKKIFHQISPSSIHPRNPSSITSKCPIKEENLNIELNKSPLDLMSQGFLLRKDEHILPENERRDFLLILATDFDVCKSDIVKTVKSVFRISNLHSNDEEISNRLSLKSQEALRNSLVPLYLKFFRQIIMDPSGLSFLHEFRADLLDYIKNVPKDSRQLKKMDSFLKEQLQSWYSEGFLVMKQILWKVTPASIIEYIKSNEAVHPVQEWDLLKRRFEGNKKCFAFFHQSLPLEPVAFTFVALMKNMPESLMSIVSSMELPSNVSSDNKWFAIFYSISSTQKGLSGIDLGSGLIKATISQLSDVFPSLKQFGTLSPIPGFRKWLSNVSRMAKDLRPKIPDPLRNRHSDNVWDWLVNGNWIGNRTEENEPKPILLYLCSKYLYEEKKRGFALDPVANFHLKNGGILWRVNWKADLSTPRMSQSFGIMVNYYYDMDMIAQNSQSYIMDGNISIAEPISKILNLSHKSS